MRLLLSNKKQRYAIPFRLLACTVLIIGGGLLTCSAYVLAQHRVEKQTNLAFDELTHTYVAQLSQYIEAYADLLYATRGLFAATDVNTKNWKSFIEVQNAESRYPGMKAIGYAEVVHEQDVAGYQAQLRSETGNAAITVHPNAVADNNVILKYHEPTAATSPGQAQAVGFVLSSSAERLKALKQAEKTGKIAAAAPVQLATNSAPGFLLILPLSDKPTLEKGSRSVFGYSVAAFEIAPLIDSTIGPRLTQYGTSLTITDISEDDAVLYSTPVGSGLRSLTRDVVIQVADRQWRLTFQTPSRNLIMAAGRYAPMGILGIGIVAILASCVLIYAIKLRKKMSDAIVS